MDDKKNFKIIQEHLITKGFIFPNSEIYGGFANTYDYGPLGTLLLKNIRDWWWQEFITKEPYHYGLESKTLLNPLVWKASGHLDNFADLVVENKINQKRYRVDHLLEDYSDQIDFNNVSNQEIENFLKKQVTNYDGAVTEWGPIRQFNLMFETYQGVVEGQKNKIYLRPELAQGIFINFKNVVKTMNASIPFAIGQIGTSFRNEVTVRNFIFRTREFTQMELEHFTHPRESDEKFNYFQNKIDEFLKLMGLQKNNYRWRQHEKDQLAHYAIATSDVEYNFPFGWGEIIGLANRGDFDLKNHFSKKENNDFCYVDPNTNEKFIPYVIEPSIGLDRLMLAILVDAWTIEDDGSNNSRSFLKLAATIAPYQIAILPVVKKLHRHHAQNIFKKMLNHNLRVTYDENGKIGKRFRIQDEIGTPLVITIDDQSVEKNLLTIRDRDTKKQTETTYEEFIQNIKKYFK